MCMSLQNSEHVNGDNCNQHFAQIRNVLNSYVYRPFNCSSLRARMFYLFWFPGSVSRAPSSSAEVRRQCSWDR